MEDSVGGGSESVAQSPAGAIKSKLDTLSKDDLIKFAKKQIAGMQKMKIRCADLEKEIEVLKQQPKSNSSASDDSTLLQELTERMDTLLLDKAELQQSLALSCRDLESNKQKSKEELAMLHQELDNVKEDHQSKIKTLECSIEKSSSKHQEEIAFFQKLLKERDEIDKQRESEREGECFAEQNAKDKLAALQQELDHVVQNHQCKIEMLENSIKEINSKHQEEVAFFQNLVKEKEEIHRQRESERECEHAAEQSAAKEIAEKLRRSLETQLETLRTQLEATEEQKTQEIVELQDEHQKNLTEAQQEVENLKEELAQINMQHEEEMRALEEECEVERERLLSIQDQLTEQLALKDSYLQDVKEEDEESALGSGIAKMLELSGFSQVDSSNCDGEDTGRSRAALEELQAQNTMLKDELTLLGNVKEELEAELERTKEEFQVEREELEFKINELHMARESFSNDRAATTESELQGEVQQQSKTHKKHQEDKLPNECCQPRPLLGDRNHLTLEEAGARCEELTRERDVALAECHHMRNILQGVETELGEKTNDFIQQYNAMKEQSASTAQGLQDRLKQLKEERDELLEGMRSIAEEKNSLITDVQDLKRKLDASAGEDQKLQISVQEQTMLANELKQSVEELTKKNEEMLSQLQTKENTSQDLKNLVQTLTVERDQIQSQFQQLEEEMQKLKSEKDKEVQKLLEEKESEVCLIREEKEKLLLSLQNEGGDVQQLKQELEKMAHFKEEIERGQETISALEQSVKDLSSEKTILHQKLEEITALLSESHESKEDLGYRLAVLEAEFEQKISEKNLLEEKLSLLKEETEKASATIKALERNQAEALALSGQTVDELQTHIVELEKERDSLRSSVEEAQGVLTSEEAEKELQARILDLEQERNMLRNNLEEVERDSSGLQRDLEHMKAVSERIIKENKNLQEQNSQQNEEKEKEMENVEKERKQLRDQLTEKESLISQMKTEIAALQESAAESAASEENAAREKTDQTALLEEELKTKDEKFNKMKAVAIKAKKELDISKKEVASLKEEVESLKTEREKTNNAMKDIIHGAEGYKNLQIDYDRQTEQLDKEQEKVEAAERQITELTKRLSSAVAQNEAMNSEKEDLLAGIETARNTLRQLETQIQELQRQVNSYEKDLLAERAVKEQKMKDLSFAMKEVEELTAQLHKQQQQSQQTAQELEQLRKEAQQNSLLGMEMADYERLVKELNANLLGKDECVEELKAQICTMTQREETLKQEIEALKLQQDQGEEKTSKIKQLLVKTKKDLADAKKQESSLLVQQASLKGELEGIHQQLETSKIEMCEVTAQCHRLQEQLRSSLEQQQKTSSSLQQHIISLQQESDTLKAELAATTAEFDGYKVRVHNVLKQQKSKTTNQSDGDACKIEREQLSSQVELLRLKLTESQQNLQSTSAELQQLQAEHDTLLERHNKILQETICKEAELRERVLSLQSENASLQAELSQAQADLSSRVETQRQTYREQLRKLQDDHRTTVETLQGQLTRVEEQLFHLQSQNMLVQSGRKSLSSDSQRRNTDQSQSGLGIMTLSDLQSMAREEGEGMETTETESMSPAVAPLTSFEHLLTSPDPKHEPFVWNVEPTKEELTQKLNTATRSMEHMNGLLHETEATNAVLMEQITLLKSELRRLERNQEREKSVANLEYLKNVLLQFIFLRSGSERQALLPVIHTMLQLSPEEKSKLAAIAQGEEEGTGSRGSGWSSYLHSWSGIR